MTARRWRISSTPIRATRLFQVSEDELFATALGILRLGERPKVRVFLRFDRFDRFVSALVFVPRDRYDTDAREKIHAILAKAFNGRMSAANPTHRRQSCSRASITSSAATKARARMSTSRELEAQIREAIRTWDDGLLRSADGRQHGDAEARAFSAAMPAPFPPRYRDVFSPDEAVRDLDELVALARIAGEAAIKARAYRCRRRRRTVRCG